MRSTPATPDAVKAGERSPAFTAWTEAGYSPSSIMSDTRTTSPICTPASSSGVVTRLIGPSEVSSTNRPLSRSTAAIVPSTLLAAGVSVRMSVLYQLLGGEE